MPCCVVGVGLTEGGSSDWTSFLFLPVSTRSYRQGTGNGVFISVCVCICVCVSDSGRPFAQPFLNLKVSLNIPCVFHRQSVAHTPNQSVFTPASFLFSTSRFDLKQGQGSLFVTQTNTLLLGYTIPPTKLVHGPVNATAVCVCVCVCVCASQLSATLPHILSLPLFCLHASPSHYLYLSPSLFPPLKSNIRVAEQQSYGESK